MRERLIAAFVALAVCIIALYGIPRAFMIADTVRDGQEQQTARLAELLAIVIAEHELDRPMTGELLQSLLTEDESAVYTRSDGSELRVGAAPGSDGVSSQTEVAGGGTITVARSGDVVSQRLTSALLPVIFIGIALLVISVIGAVLLARFISRPFVQVAETARNIGRGRLDDEERPVLTIPEARAIDDALRASARTLEHRIRREHEFAANASHQLRTPITALRLELEDLSLWPETPPTVREQLDHAVREIDRLTEAITQLLELARGESPGMGGSAPLDDVLRGAARRWSAQASASDREIRLTGIDAGLGSAPAAASQILDVLLHNAIKHGRGTITISGKRRAEYVTVQVADEGERPRGNVIFQRRPEQRSATSGEGIGLALSAELAESLGGHLLLEGDETTTFSLILPAGN